MGEKITKIIGLKRFVCAALAALVVGCAEEDSANIPQTPKFEGGKALVSLADFAAEDASRTSFVDGEGGTSARWAAGDKVGFVPEKGKQTKFEVSSEGVGLNTAEFVGSEGALKPKEKYFAYYPFSSDNFIMATASEPVAAVFTGQKQARDGETAHLGAADYMAAVVTTPEEGVVSFDFNHLCSLVRIEVCTPVEAKCSSVSLTTKEGAFTTSGQFVLTDEEIAISATKTASQITLELNDIEMKAGETASFCMMMAPTDLSMNDSLRLELTMSSGVKYSTMVEAKNFEAGKEYLLKANFTELDFTDFAFEGSTSTDINTNSGIITVNMPYGSDLSQLVASFTAAGDAEVFVGEEKQVPGVTANDFSMPVEYKIVRDGKESLSTVAVGYSGIPVLYISTPGPILDKTNWVKGSTLCMVNAGEANAIYENASLKGRGNTTWNYAKKPYAIKLDKKAEVLGMPKHKRWVLLANYIDRTAMRNSAAFEIAKKAEGLAWTPHGYFVDVVMNGKFLGNYYLCEQIKIDKNRVNITEMTADDLDEENITGGYLCELDTYFDEVNKFRTKFGKAGDSQTGMPVNIKEPDEDVLQPSQLDYIEDYFFRLESLLYADDFPAKGEYRDLLDVSSFIDWWLAGELAQNAEANWPKSSYMYKDRGGKLCAGPIWDNDWATFPAKSSGWRNIKAIYYARLFKDPKFVELVKERWAVMKANLADISEIVSAIAAENKMSVEYNNKIWSATTAVNGDEALSYDAAIARLQKSIKDRIAWMDAAIKDL